MQDGEKGGQEVHVQGNVSVYSEHTAFVARGGYPYSTCTTHGHQDQEQNTAVTRLGRVRTDHYHHILPKLVRSKTDGCVYLRYNGSVPFWWMFCAWSTPSVPPEARACTAVDKHTKNQMQHTKFRLAHSSTNRKLKRALLMFPSRKVVPSMPRTTKIRYAQDQ